MKSLKTKIFKKNRKGESSVVSSIIMIIITVAAMVLVITYGQNIINLYNGQMGERLVVEKVLFMNNNQVQVFVRNIGHRELTLTQVKIDTTTFELDPKISLLEQQGNYVTLSGSFASGVHQISFYSSRYNELGSMEVNYL